VVDSYYAAAVCAATQMRCVILIESEVPQNDTLSPVARSFDNEIRLSHQHSFSGEMIVDFGLGFRAAPVTMCGSAC